MTSATRNWLPIIATSMATFGASIAVAQEQERDGENSGPRPSRMFNVVDFGAVGDGATVNTEAFATTISACAKSGGGTVFVLPRRSNERRETRIYFD